MERPECDSLRFRADVFLLTLREKDPSGISRNRTLYDIPPLHVEVPRAIKRYSPPPHGTMISRTTLYHNGSGIL